MFEYAMDAEMDVAPPQKLLTLIYFLRCFRCFHSFHCLHCSHSLHSYPNTTDTRSTSSTTAYTVAYMPTDIDIWLERYMTRSQMLRRVPCKRPAKV